MTWVVRRKRAQLPRNADERDRARFAKAQSYMVRRDDKLACANVRCRKPFEITSLQSLAFLTMMRENGGKPVSTWHVSFAHLLRLPAGAKTRRM